MGQIIVETKFAEGDHVQWQQRTRTDKICGECGSHFEEKGVETFAGTVVKYQVLISEGSVVDISYYIELDNTEDIGITQTMRMEEKYLSACERQ